MCTTLEQLLSTSAEILTPGQSRYAQAATQFSSKYASQEWAAEHLCPATIIKCACVQDVVAFVRYANTHQIQLTARSGGHSYTGHSSRPRGRPGWVVDLSKMNTIDAT